MKRVIVFLAVLLAVAVSPAAAGDRFGIGVKAGTLGLGVDVTGRITNWFCLRGTANQYDLSHSYSEEGIDYDGDFAIGAYGLMADFHPFKGNFRLTVGYLKNRNDFDLQAVPTQDVTIGDGTYTPAEAGTLTGNIAFEDHAEYFGLGFGDAAKGPGRVRFVLDLGVMRQGAGQVTLQSSSPLVLQSDLAKEAQQIEDDISSYDYWPILALGVSFRL